MLRGHAAGKGPRDAGALDLRLRIIDRRARTVALLRQAGPAALNQRVKMPRREVRALLWRIALGLGSAAVLQKEFRKLSGEPLP